MTTRRLVPIVILSALAAVPPSGAGDTVSNQALVSGEPSLTVRDLPRLERVNDPFVPVPRENRTTHPARSWTRNGHLSVQVNVDGWGFNILGDAANEPSIAIDPSDPARMAIGWRQFDTVSSDFRQAGYAYSTDGGQSWTFPGVLEPGVFRSDPVLDFAADGTFFYNSLSIPYDYQCDVFRSSDGGASWDAPVYAYGGDKQWMGIDRTGGIGHGHIYQAWSLPSYQSFNRSVDGGQSFGPPVAIPTEPHWGVTTVGPDGAVYVVGAASTPSGFAVAKSTSAQDPGAPFLVFDFAADVDLGGSQRAFVTNSPNPVGLLGQVWIAVDHSSGPGAGNVYVLCSVEPPSGDPMDVHFVRSSDGGLTWTSPVRVNDDPVGNGAWQWFGTMSVAPDGRIDAIWNDTRSNPGSYVSELYYARSSDGGLSWSQNVPLSQPFDPYLGWPQQAKLGDYYDMISDQAGVHIAYSATFNGEQDVYYLRLDLGVLFADGFESGDSSAWSLAEP